MNQPNTGNTGNPNPADQNPNPPAGTGNQPAPSAPGTQNAGVTPPTGDKGGAPQVPLAALQEEREKRQALQDEVEQLKRLVTGNSQQAPNYGVPQRQAVQQNIDPYGTNWHQEIEKLWETDPRRAVQAEIMKAFSWYDGIQANIDSEAENLSQKYSDFNNYRAQALNYVRSLPQDQRGTPGIVELAYMLVRGQNVDNILKSKEEELMQKFQSGQTAGSYNIPGSYSTPTTPQGTVQLTPEQKAAANAMGISEADYISQMQR